MYKVCLIRVKELIVEKISTVTTHRNDDWPILDSYSKHSKWVLFQIHELFDDIDFRKHFVIIRVGFKQNKIVPYQNKVSVSTLTTMYLITAREVNSEIYFPKG